MTLNNGFRELGINDRWIDALEAEGVTSPTNVQAEAIPAILAGKDVVAQSQTGTGKTLAYLLPMLQAIDLSSKHLQALVIVPTRELGVQILQVIDSLTNGMDKEHKVRSQALIGGAALSRQVDKLKEHPHIAVGTPGRIVELLRIRKLTVHHVQSVVIDEVDQVYALGSVSELDTILKGMQKTRQLLFFSATVTDTVYRAAHERMEEPVEVAINPEQLTSATIGHQYYVCEERNKLDTLRRLIHILKPTLAIVFINSTSDVSDVLSRLQHVGLSAHALSGFGGKGDRAQAMQGFRDQKFQLLLATDVAARGLDIEGVTHIFHLDLPINNEYYLHRVGRTGRMGRKGMAISIVTPKEVWIVEKIAKQLNIDIALKEMFGGKIIEPGGAKKPASSKNTSHSNKASFEQVGAKAKSTSRDQPTNSLTSGQASTAASGANKSSNTKDKHKQPGQVTPPKRKSNKELERERKNKGAPKWLKAKRDDSSSDKV